MRHRIAAVRPARDVDQTQVRKAVGEEPDDGAEMRLERPGVLRERAVFARDRLLQPDDLDLAACEPRAPNAGVEVRPVDGLRLRDPGRVPAAAWALDEGQAPVRRRILRRGLREGRELCHRVRHPDADDADPPADRTYATSRVEPAQQVGPRRLVRGGRVQAAELAAVPRPVHVGQRPQARLPHGAIRRRPRLARRRVSGDGNDGEGEERDESNPLHPPRVGTRC